MKGKTFFLVVAAVLVATLRVASAEELPEYQVKAEFIERFTRFIDWPAPAAGNRERPRFVIGIYGRSPFRTYLSDMASSHRIKGKPIEIRQLTSLDSLTGCDVVFISSSERKTLPKILPVVAERSVLTVGDTPGFAEEGVLINFFTDGDKVRFEINASAVEKSGLKMTSKLLKLARVVEGSVR
ncbi:MAG TPA: YfiR family protein [Thermoanaerobaculia bacterium]|nr:YfiR family protein [Thermoanaerobaculia bacterium]